MGSASLNKNSVEEMLNIIDANVGAHLLQFNVSEDLSFEPYIENHYFDFSQSAGIKFKINLD